MIFNIIDYMLKYNETSKINYSYKKNINIDCKICNIEINKNYYCKKCDYNLNLFIKTIDYFFIIIKQLKKYNSNLIIDIFNNFKKFKNLLKFDNNQNILIYLNIIKKIKKLIDSDIKNIGYTSSNTKTFIYHIFK